MKITIFTVAFLFIVTINFAQNITKEFITGSWKVTEVFPQEMTKDAKMKDLYYGFANATLTFNENNNFSLTTTKSSKIMEMMLEMFKNNKWKLVADKNQIKVGTTKDNYSVFGIQVGSKDDKVVFALSESGIYLFVEKQ